MWTRCLWLLVCVTSCLVGAFGDRTREHIKSTDQPTINIEFIVETEGMDIINETDDVNFQTVSVSQSTVSERLTGLSQGPLSTQTTPRSRYRVSYAKLVSEPRSTVSEGLTSLSQAPPSTQTTPRSRNRVGNAKVVSEPRSTLSEGHPGYSQATPSKQTMPRTRYSDGNAKRGDRWYLQPNYQRHGGKNYVYSNRRYQTKYRVNGRWWYYRGVLGKTRKSMGRFRSNRY